MIIVFVSISEWSTCFALTHRSVLSSLLNDGLPGSRKPPPYSSASGTLGFHVFQVHGPFFSGAVKVLSLTSRCVCTTETPSEHEPCSDEQLWFVCPPHGLEPPEEGPPLWVEAYAGVCTARPCPTQLTCTGVSESAPLLCTEERSRTLRTLPTVPRAQHRPRLSGPLSSVYLVGAAGGTSSLESSESCFSQQPQTLGHHP